MSAKCSGSALSRLENRRRKPYTHTGREERRPCRRRKCQSRVRSCPGRSTSLQGRRFAISYNSACLTSANRKKRRTAFGVVDVVCRKERQDSEPQTSTRYTLESLTRLRHGFGRGQREAKPSSLHHFQLSGSELRQMRMQNSVAEMNWCHSWTCSSSPLLFGVIRSARRNHPSHQRAQAGGGVLPSWTYVKALVRTTAPT